MNQESNQDALAKVPKKNFVCSEKMLEFLFSLCDIIFPFSLLVWEIHLKKFGSGRKILPCEET